MILINKIPAAPAKLAEGAALVQALEDERLADPNAGGSRKTSFKFDKKIYGQADVKRALRKAQHDKCCYCEGFFAAHASGDVEHFRPKTCFQQVKGGPFEYPGYYWLAYTWSNLYYACEICNRIGKRSLFPLADVTQRRRSGADVGNEVPDIIDPGGPYDPRAHIAFNGPAPFGIGALGKTTIAALGLDRGDLTTARLQHLKLLDALKALAGLAPEGLDDATIEKCEKAVEELKRCVEPTAIYSAMAQDYLAA